MEVQQQQQEMTDKWYKNWANDNDYDYNMEAFEDWLYCWRVANGLCEADDFEQGAFAVEEPQYGWSDFDNEYFKIGCESAAKRIAELLGK